MNHWASLLGFPSFMWNINTYFTALLKKKSYYLKFAHCFEDEKGYVLSLTQLQRDVVYFCSGNFCHLVPFEECIYLEKNLLYMYKSIVFNNNHEK